MWVCTAPNPAKGARRKPRTEDASTLGTLRFTTLAGVAVVATTALAARSAAVSQCSTSPKAMLTASAGHPSVAAVSAAPTVPECRTR